MPVLIVALYLVGMVVAATVFLRWDDGVLLGDDADAEALVVLGMTSLLWPVFIVAGLLFFPLFVVGRAAKAIVDRLT